ncbi:hypothetical protein SAMN05519104_1862 [Rhizobiales bacterium GAS188]|nr:hypothetical protein SAMN05519104_1862 [Rhizobiales bacterium GAS188]
MLKRKLALAIISAACLAFVATSASAQASRTWVSGVGDDANPCSRTAPCKTFAGAISKTAVGGEIDVLDPGGFGAVTITKAITIDGGGGQVASTLVSGTNGIVVAAGPSDIVTLRNLRINGLGTGVNGIQFQSGVALHVENCTIFGFTQNAINIALGSASSTQVDIVDTVVTNSGGGISAKTTGAGNVFVAVQRSSMKQNSSFGFKADGTGGGSGTIYTNVSDSLAAGNGTGLWAASGAVGTVAIILTRSSVVNNTTNGLLSDQSVSGSAFILASNSEITQNGTGLKSLNLGGLYTYKNNAVDGNFVTNGAFTNQLTPE